MQSISFTLFGLTLYWYGLLVGLGVVVAFLVAEKRALTSGTSAKEFSQAASISLALGFFGARLWHVATDWPAYALDPWAIFYFTSGGMSIFGGILGGALGLWWAARKKQVFLKLSDSIVFAVPLGQAVGRIGNWVNQELYGLPTSLPWGIYIAPEKRLLGFEQFAYFHPLFAYEALALLAFVFVVWRLEKLQPEFWKVGTGRVTLSYLLFYSVLRFVLDFFRPDKAILFGNLGVNQSFVALFALGVCAVLLLRNKRI